MKDALNAFLIATALALFTLSFSKFSIGGFIVLWAVWTVPVTLFFIVRNIIHNRRLRVENADTAELPIPDTQPLDRK